MSFLVTFKLFNALLSVSLDSKVRNFLPRVSFLCGCMLLIGIRVNFQFNHLVRNLMNIYCYWDLSMS